MSVVPQRSPGSPRRVRHPPPRNPTSATTPAKRRGLASTSTPFKTSSALTNGAATANSNPSYLLSTQSTSATSAPATQIEMDQYIEAELQGAIFHDPKFVDRFFTGDAAKLDKVHRECGLLDGHYSRKTKWNLPSTIRTEKSLYAPVLHILNTIKRAVDIVQASPSEDQQPATSDPSNPLTSDDDPSENYVPEQPQFINTSTYSIPSDRTETALIKPDLVLFEDIEDNHRHWEHVRMPVEIKKLTSYHKAGMKQLSRYARAVFAHQLHRRHLYAMMVCNTEATFVRFDRAGILYSRRINLRTDSKAFTYAFASLLMLDRTDQGYDPAFTCTVNEEGRLDYFVDLPASAFATKSSNDESTPNEDIDTLHFLVVDRLCHRRNISGRATIVLRIRRVDQGDESEGEEYVLKIMWRDPERGLEGEVLQKAKGRFGLAQHVWHSDAFGSCHCSPKVDGLWKCHKCVAETVQLDNMEVCDALVDVAIEVPPEEEDKDPELRAVDTSVCHATSRKRPHRICTYIVISTKGVPLERAESPRQFMRAVLDAILGYWALFNMGILHRDISEGNVMMLSPDQQLAYQLDEDETLAQIKDSALVESEKKLREVLEELGDLKPTGMLSDFDLHAFHSLDVSHETPVQPAGSEDQAPASIQSAAGLADSTQPHTAPTSSRSRGSRPREDDTTPDVQTFKKRRIGRRHYLLANTTEKPPAAPSYVVGAGEKKRLIDFRTGTPAFMSIRVLTVQPGERYHHSFMDDLESFFWLIFWSAAAHLDSERPINSYAQGLLNRLNRSDLESLKSEKVALLSDCDMPDGIEMLNRLERIDNEWAVDPIFVDVIIEFGKLSYDYYRLSMRNVYHAPVDVFPSVIRIFQNALDSNDD